MSDVEFFSKLNPKRLTSLDEDFKREQMEYLADAARFKKYGTNKQSVADLIATGQVLPASELTRTREQELEAQKAFEDAVKSEKSHRKSKHPTGVGPSRPIYSREPFQD